MKSRLGITLAILLCTSLQVSALEIVSNPSVKVDSLPLSSLRAIFSMRLTQWPDGTPIRVFVLGDKSPMHSEFSKQVLGVFPHQLRRAWNRQIYSGTGQAPTKVDTEAEMHAQVKSTPGAIGYLSEDQINEHVQALDIK